METADFVNDTRTDAYARLMDRVLASPRYGERWARHWMDVVRYADTNGFETNRERKSAYHYRDYIIASLNSDKPYDRFIKEQIAGDALGVDAATGFLVAGPHDIVKSPDINLTLMQRQDELADMVNTTGTAFLGLTMNCVKCHDHKYDPLTTTDYYAMRAIFEPYHARLDELPGTTDLEKDGLPRAYDLHLDRPTYIHVKGDEKKPDTNQVIRAAVPATLAFKPLQIQPVKLPPPAHNPALQPWVLSNHLAAAQEQIITARQAVETAKKKLAEVERNGARTPTSAAAQPDAGIRAPNASPAPTTKIATSAAKPFFTDNFSAANPALWELRDGQWSYTDGVLRQSEVKPARSAARSRVEHPADFVATFKFRPTGGATYKSVGFTFDTTEARESLVYLSAHAPGPKLQIAYGKANQYA